MEKERLLKAMEVAEKLEITRAYVSFIANKLNIPGKKSVLDGRVRLYTPEEVEMIGDYVYDDHLLNADTLRNYIIKHQGSTVNDLRILIGCSYATVSQVLIDLTFQDPLVCEDDDELLFYKNDEFFEKYADRY